MKSYDSIERNGSVFNFSEHDNSTTVRAVLPCAEKECDRALTIFNRWVRHLTVGINLRHIRTFEIFLDFYESNIRPYGKKGYSQNYRTVYR